MATIKIKAAVAPDPIPSSHARRRNHPTDRTLSLPPRPGGGRMAQQGIHPAPRRNRASDRQASSLRARRTHGNPLLVDTVEKVARKSRACNNRIKKGRYSNQRCADGWIFESKLRRDPLEIFFQHYRSLSKQRWAAVGPFGCTVVPLAEALKIIASEPIFWVGI